MNSRATFAPSSLSEVLSIRITFEPEIMDERIRIGFDENPRYNSSFVARSTKQKNTKLDLDDDKESLISNTESEFEDDDDLSIDNDTTLEKDFRPDDRKTDTRFESEGHIEIWKPDPRREGRSTDICSFHNDDVTLTDKTEMLSKYRLNRKVSPRPAVVRTTWCDFSDSHEQQQSVSHQFDSTRHYNKVMEDQWFQDEICQQQTLIAEHSVEWGEINENVENNSSYLSPNDSIQTSVNESCENEIGPYYDIYEHQHTNLNLENDSSENPIQNLKSTNIVRKKSKRKRVFQKFWCATDEDDGDVQELPRPDAYRLKSRIGSQSSQKQRNVKSLGSSFKRKFLGNTADEETFITTNDLMYRDDTDERGGIRRRPKVWECLDKTEPDFKKDAKIYAPKRPPPILDFFMVVTSFFVASVLAYYSAT